MKALVTGYPGTGKSSVAHELKQRGHNAFDTESMRGYMHAENIQSGKRLPLPDPVPRGWFESTGGYNWDIIRILRLLDSYEDIYICALADNQDQLFNSFDKIFLLTLDEIDMEHRLRMRQSTNYGKDPDELADILFHHHHFENSLLDMGAIQINTKRSTQDIEDKILSYATGSDNR